jgi:hypothetical protein
MDRVRGRRSRVAVGLGIVAVAAPLTAWLAPAQGDSAKRGCDARRGATLAANEQVRVYRVGGRRQFAAYGCFQRTGKVVYLGGQVVGEPPHESPAFDFLLSGRFVAVDNVVCEPDACRGPMTVHDLRTGAVRNSRRVDGAGGVSQSWVLKRNGAIAWTRVLDGTFEVVKLDRDGEAVIDQGDDVDVQSLALAGSTLYWTKAGVPRTAQLR